MEQKAERKDKPWVPVIIRWLHKYELWKSRLEYLAEKRMQEPKTVARVTGMPGGGGLTGNSTLDTAQARIEATEDYHYILERVHIMDLAFRAMKDAQMELIRTVYFAGVPENQAPWDALHTSERTYYRNRRRAFEIIYFVGFETIDQEAQKRKWQKAGRDMADKTGKAVVQ